MLRLLHEHWADPVNWDLMGLKWLTRWHQPCGHRHPIGGWLLDLQV